MAIEVEQWNKLLSAVNGEFLPYCVILHQEEEKLLLNVLDLRVNVMKCFQQQSFQ